MKNLFDRIWRRCRDLRDLTTNLRFRLRRCSRVRYRHLLGCSLPDEAITTSNTREAYELLYRSPDHLAEYLGPGRIEFYDEVADYCAAYAHGNVIDLGCGSGHFLKALKSARVRGSYESCNVSYYGIDFAHSAIELASKTVVDGVFKVASVYNVEYPDNSFDLVILMEVLEHIKKPKYAIREAARLCRPNSTIVITVPNGDIDTFMGHINFWNGRQFMRFLKRAVPIGVIVEEILKVDKGRTLLARLSKAGKHHESGESE